MKGAHAAYTRTCRRPLSDGGAFRFLGREGDEKLGDWSIEIFVFILTIMFFSELTNTFQNFHKYISKLLQIQGWQQEANQNEKSGAAVIDSPRKFAWKLGSCRNYRPTINQRIMSQTRTRVVQTCQSFLDSFAGIFQSFERMAETIFHALLCNNIKKAVQQPYSFFLRKHYW